MLNLKLMLMKEKFVIHDDRGEFEKLDAIAQRAAILLRTGGMYFYHVITISDLDGKGWYVSNYHSMPHLSNNGNVYWRGTSTAVTYKNKKFYGNINTLGELFQRVPKFQFLRDTVGLPYRIDIGSTRKMLVSSIPKTVLAKILDGKITSQEDLWKAISKVSYKDNHWKVVRFCKSWGIPISLLKMTCPNYEAILQTKHQPSHEFVEALRYAAVLGVKCNPLWSGTRLSEELTQMKIALKSRELNSKSQNSVWDKIPDFGDFHLVNTELDAFRVGEIEFSNCVYNCYWPKINRKQYVVLTSKDLCIGYQIMSDGDVMFDQIHGPRNSYIDPQIRNATDAFLRPLVQQLIADNQGLIPDHYEEIDLPY